MEKKDPIELAQLIVRGSYINFDFKSAFKDTSSIYRFTNEEIASYFHHLKDKKKVLTVIGSGGQILNGILGGNKYIDCFDISIFPEYYLYLQIASILALSKDEYLKYYFSEDREELFGDYFYDKISNKLKGKYKEFWDTLYMFDDGIDIYNSLLFRSDLYIKNNIIDNNPYLQENNYEKLKHILNTDSIKIKPMVSDIMKSDIKDSYDLINLSNILTYYYKEEEIDKLIEFLKKKFSLNDNGEIINYFFKMKKETIDNANNLLNNNGHVENLKNNKLLVYKKNNN